MTQKFAAFKALHQKGDPVVLYNIWDAGSAKAVANGGASALATGSAPLAAAQGFADGENIPLELACEIVSRIVACTDLPVSMDFEGAYAVEPDGITRNVAKMLETGAVGLNFEDQIVGGTGIYDAEIQCSRIQAVRAASADLFINARTDLFLQESDHTKHSDLMAETISRAEDYHKAGADCFFVPGLVDAGLIEMVCDASPIPVNILKKPTAPSHAELAKLGVGRISYGPIAHNALMATLTERVQNL